MLALRELVRRRSSCVIKAACLALAAAAMHLSAPGLAEAESGKSVEVATLHWPPYTGIDLPFGGAVTTIVRAAFAQQGYDVQVRVWPWKRAVAKAKADDNGIVGYYPGYHCRHDPAASFQPSTSLGARPLGLAEHTGRPQSWSSIEDLKTLRIGTVVGYANSEAFDRALMDGQLRTVTASDDAANLRRLLEQRIDYAVVDKFVLAYLLMTDPLLRANAGKIRFDERLLEMTNLYLCFRNDDRGNRFREIFNRGLQRLDPNAMIDRYIERLVRG